jgi:UDP-MurNAc hydroxylase
MKIHMIGHAGIFVETQDCKIIIDPVLWDSHMEGIESIFPQREVIHEKIPEFDLLIISHRHLDHFDIRSLASLPKDVDVLIPTDQLLATCLRNLGYSQIYYLKDFSEVKIGSTRLIATRSEYRIPEYGLLIADPSGVFWNQVDSDISLDTIRFVKSRYPQIDFLLAAWCPMLQNNYRENRSLSFPYSAYSRWLGNIGLIKPKAIAPGANGFKSINGSSWLNQITFPLTRQQFCKDAKIVCPDIGQNIFELDPGDTLSFSNGEFEYIIGGCHFVNKLDDQKDELDFLPVNIGNSIIDDNIDEYDLNEMRHIIEQEVCIHLPKFINENKQNLFLSHFNWNIIYQLEIIFPNFIGKWHFDFSDQKIYAKPGKNVYANLFSITTASCFYSILNRTKGWDYVSSGGYYGSFQKIYSVTPYGIIKPTSDEIVDPLYLRFPYTQIFESIRHQEVERWKQADDNRVTPYESKTFMMKIGNTLVRLEKINKKTKEKEICLTEELSSVTTI